MACSRNRASQSLDRDNKVCERIVGRIMQATTACAAPAMMLLTFGSPVSERCRTSPRC
jgi:hypothetical protein